jgi:hypothetical protein
MTEIKLKSPIPIGATKHIDVEWWNETHQSELSGEDDSSSISSEHSSSFDSIVLKASSAGDEDGAKLLVKVRDSVSYDKDESERDKLGDSTTLISPKPDDKSLFSMLSLATDHEDSVDDCMSVYDTLVGGLDVAMSSLSDVLQSSADVRQEFKVQWETTMSSFKNDIKRIDEEIENAILDQTTRCNKTISDEGADNERHTQTTMDDTENYQILQMDEITDKGGEWLVSSSVSNLLTALQLLREEEACLINQLSNDDQPWTSIQDQCAK